MIIRDGRYSYRFAGHSMVSTKNEPWHLVGIGSLLIENNSILSGLHRSTIHRHHHADSKFMHSAFAISGTVSWDHKEHNWMVNILFDLISNSNPNGPQQQKLDAYYRVVAGSNDDEYWFISAGSKLLVSNPATNLTKEYPTSEVVDGVIHRVDES